MKRIDYRENDKVHPHYGSEELPKKPVETKTNLDRLKQRLWRYLDEKTIDEIWQDGYNTGLKHMDQMHAKIDNQKNSK